MVGKIPTILAAFVAINTAYAATADTQSERTAANVLGNITQACSIDQAECTKATIFEVKDLAREIIGKTSYSQGFKGGIANGQLRNECLGLADVVTPQNLQQTWLKIANCVSSEGDVISELGIQVDATKFNTLANHVNCARGLPECTR